MIGKLSKSISLHRPASNVDQNNYTNEPNNNGNSFPNHNNVNNNNNNSNSAAVRSINNYDQFPVALRELMRKADAGDLDAMTQIGTTYLPPCPFPLVYFAARFIFSVRIQSVYKSTMTPFLPSRLADLLTFSTNS